MKAKIPKAKGIKKIVCHELAVIIVSGVLDCKIIDKNYENLSDEVKSAVKRLCEDDYIILKSEFYIKVDKIAGQIWQELFEGQE